MMVAALTLAVISLTGDRPAWFLWLTIAALVVAGVHWFRANR